MVPNLKVPLSSVALSESEKKYAHDAIDSSWISSSGPYVQRLKDSLASYTKRKHVTLTSSGTSALALVLRAMDIGPGDEVIVPALTFAAPASAVAAVGATPVFVDITAADWTIDPELLPPAITTRTRALIAVDLLGHPCHFSQLERHGIPIIEDAAEAFGARYADRPVGSFGIASICSFHANKTITTGEGGCTLTDDDTIAERIALMNNHGMSPTNPYIHREIGQNFRMTNVAAAIGFGQIERCAELVAARNHVSRQYDELLGDLPIERRPVAQWAEEATWLHTVASRHKPAILQSCAQRGVDARSIWPALPDQPIFRNDWIGHEFPVARRVSAQSMWLPTWAFMPREAIESVATAIRAAHAL